MRDHSTAFYLICHHEGMALLFVTGVAATGNSTIAKELRARGHVAYDTDDDALARWQNARTGYIHPKSSVKAADRTVAFLAEHNWNVPREFVERIAEEAAARDAFICGVAHNFADLNDLFEKVFALVIDEATLRERIATRTNNDWGKQPHELEQTLQQHALAMEQYRQQGFIIVDATPHIPRVVDTILDSMR